MKYFSLFSLCLILASAGVAQSTYDSRLLQKHTAERLDVLSKTNPELVEYWTFVLDHSIVLVDAIEGKNSEIRGEVRIKKNEPINLYALGLGNPGMEPRYYRIKNSNQLLVVRSSAQLAEDFRNYKLGH